MQRDLGTEILYCNVQTPSTAEAVPLPQIAACAAGGGKSDKTPGGLRLPVGYAIAVSPGSQGEFRGGLPPPFCPLRGHFPRWGNLPSDFSPRKAKNSFKSVFSGGAYLGKNSSQPASVKCASVPRKRVRAAACIPLVLLKCRKGISIKRIYGLSWRYASRYCLAEFSQETSLAMSRSTISSQRSRSVKYRVLARLTASSSKPAS